MKELHARKLSGRWRYINSRYSGMKLLPIQEGNGFGIRVRLFALPTISVHVAHSLNSFIRNLIHPSSLSGSRPRKSNPSLTCLD